MRNQQSFSHGLLYAVAPENFSTLHLHDENEHDEFDLGVYESKFADDSFVQAVLDFLTTTITKR